MSWLVAGWIELIAVDGGCKRSYRGRYLKNSSCQVMIDLGSALNRFRRLKCARVHNTSFDFY